MNLFFLFLSLIVIYFLFPSNKINPTEHYNSSHNRNRHTHPTINKNNIDLNNQRNSNDFYEVNDYTTIYQSYDDLNNNIFGYFYSPNIPIYNGNYKNPNKCIVNTTSELQFTSKSETNNIDISKCNKIINNNVGSYKTYY